MVVLPPHAGGRNPLQGYRVPSPLAVQALPLGHVQLSMVNITEFHCAYNHAHEGLFRETAKGSGVSLVGELMPCQGCSITGLGIP